MLLCCEGHARPMTEWREVGLMLSWRGKGHGGVASAIGRGVWLLRCMSLQIRGKNARWMRFGAFDERVEEESRVSAPGLASSKESRNVRSLASATLV